MKTLMNFDQINRLGSKEQKIKNTCAQIIEKHIRDCYIQSWITEAEELEDLFGVELPIAFLKRLAKIKKHGPDRKLLKEANEYSRKVKKTVPRSIKNAFDTYAIQMRDIERSDVPKQEKQMLKKWRTGVHGESGIGYRLNTTLRTESNAAVNLASISVYEAADIEKYRCVEVLDDRTCGFCHSINGKVFRVSEAVPGVNLSPFHPHCRGFTEPVL